MAEKDRDRTRRRAIDYWDRNHNPVKARLCGRPEGWPWSSAARSAELGLGVPGGAGRGAELGLVRTRQAQVGSTQSVARLQLAVLSEQYHELIDLHPSVTNEST